MSTKIDPVVFAEFTGLRNTIAEERLGPTDLATATNVDLDDAGQARRRRGFTQVASGSWHSLYENNGVNYGVKDGDLCAILSDFSTLTLRAGVGDQPLAYTSIGPTVYFSSPVYGGVIEDMIVRPWGKTGTVGTWVSPVVNPTANMPEVAGKLLKDPPRATALAYLNGRIYMATGQTLWATELYQYDLVDANQNYFYFEDAITSVVAVSDGLYVGTEKATYFLAGAMRGMTRVQVFGVGTVKGSAVTVDPQRVGGDREDVIARSKQAVLFLTSAGLCVGLDSGVCFNLTQGRFNFPEAQDATAMFREQDGISQYVSTVNSSGTPTGNARFGDFVDAEIRRFTGD